MILPIGETKRNNAFTLIEILLVLVVVGIILALALPNFSKGYSRFQLNKTADDLLSISRWAQAMAIGQERIYALSFSNDRSSYGLVREVAANEETMPDQNNFEPVNGALGRMHAVPDAIHLVVTQPYDSKGTGNIDRIEFYPDGTIDSATIELISPKERTTLSSTEVRGMMTKVDRE
jgi:prepilin-type N-terminal cleavage/methylation domain-containing protein